MARTNHTTWSDCIAITKRMNELHLKLAEYASRGYGKDQIYGDRMAVIAMYDLHQLLEQCLKNSMPSTFNAS